MSRLFKLHEVPMLSRLILSIKLFKSRCKCGSTPNVAIHHLAGESEKISQIPFRWYRPAFAKLIRMSQLLDTVEQVDGKLMLAHDGSIITDNQIGQRMREFKSIARQFIRYPSMQKRLMSSSGNAHLDFEKERWPVILDSLTRVCNILGVSPQQRQRVRFTVCKQVTEHRIWREALQEILKNLSTEMSLLNCHSGRFLMGQQIVSNCAQYLSDTSNLSQTATWMRPNQIEKLSQPHENALRKWGEVLEMFIHLSKCLAYEPRLEAHSKKVNSMKEGLAQIKEILVEREVISHRVARRQDHLLQNKLSKTLGHSSKCLFTLLLYYLYGSVTDIELDVCACICRSSEKTILSLGKILTSHDEGMVRSGAKQLSRALGVFKFVWETAGMKGPLDLQGHLWSLGDDQRNFTYRGYQFFMHEIKL